MSYPPNIKYLYLTVYYRLSAMVLEICWGLIWHPKLNLSATKLKKMVCSGSQRLVLVCLGTGPDYNTKKQNPPPVAKTLRSAVSLLFNIIKAKLGMDLKTNENAQTVEGLLAFMTLRSTSK